MRYHRVPTSSNGSSSSDTSSGRGSWWSVMSSMVTRRRVISVTLMIMLVTLVWMNQPLPYGCTLCPSPLDTINGLSSNGVGGYPLNRYDDGIEEGTLPSTIGVFNDARLTVHISFWYLAHRLHFLDAVISNMVTWPFGTIHIFIHTNDNATSTWLATHLNRYTTTSSSVASGAATNKESATSKHQQQGKDELVISASVRIETVVHSFINENGHYLTWRHRSLMKAQHDAKLYDYYMYCEDDLLIPRRALYYWYVIIPLYTCQ
jgi:hypothetical protein